MFDSLSGKLQNAFRNLRGLGKISESNATDALREVRMALLEADVNFKVARDFIERVKVKALGAEVVASVQPGQQIVYKWRGHPLFVRRRTPAEIASSKAVDVSSLPDPLARNANKPDSAPATDDERVIKSEWLVLIGVCTHLGCTPTVSTPASPEGEYGGWLCHCHGSQYDASGRIRKGPAPQNLAVPPYAFLSDTRIKVG